MAAESAEKAQETTFRPYIPPEAQTSELTLRAVILGALLGIVFGAVTVYLALTAGLTVSASIPVAVLSISIFKWIGKSTILENNIVQTTGSAGESIAAGVVFTLPALIFLGYSLDLPEIPRVLLLALVGALLGILFMIPLRHQLNVVEHGALTYPEGTACADVLIAGEKGGSFAGKVFGGFGIGLVYKLLNEAGRFWQPRPIYQPGWYPGATLAASVTPEYLGVGYIIGPRTAGMIFGGGVLSWLVVIPMIKFFGGGLPGAIFPGTVPIHDMDAFALWAAYIKPIGAGAVATAGLFTLGRTVPTIVRALRSSFRQLGHAKGERVATIRTEEELPGTVIFGGSILLVLVVWGLIALRINPAHLGGNLIAAILVVVFGFLFVTVSARIVGLIGASANPISGMTIATLMLTAMLFVVAGWTSGAYPAVAISIGGIVCIAAAVGGATSQSLKTGFLVGATPRRAEIAMIVGALTSVLVIGFTLVLLNRAYTRVQPLVVENVELTAEMKVVGDVTESGKSYELINVIGSHRIPDGRYFYDPAAKRIEYQRHEGIGSERLPAPQALLDEHGNQRHPAPEPPLGTGAARRLHRGNSGTLRGSLAGLCRRVLPAHFHHRPDFRRWRGKLAAPGCHQTSGRRSFERRTVRCRADCRRLHRWAGPRRARWIRRRPESRDRSSTLARARQLQWLRLVDFFDDGRRAVRRRTQETGVDLVVE